MYTDLEIVNKWQWKTTMCSRFSPIVLVADAGYVFQDFEEEILSRRDYVESVGVSGYEDAKAMQGTFLAFGPLVNQGVALPAFNGVDLYNFFCIVLRISCSSNSGKERRNYWDKLLKNNDI